MRTARVFIHGLDSSKSGTKATYFRQRYPDMVIEDFMGDLEQKMRVLQKLLAGETKSILVGSSYGGLMATLYALDHPERVSKLILLAPALTMPDFKPGNRRLSDVPVFIYHGNNDELIPAGELETIAHRHFANLIFHLLEDDHSLHQTFRTLPWDRLLEYVDDNASV